MNIVANQRTSVHVEHEKTGVLGLRFTQGLHRALQVTPDATATVWQGRIQTFRMLADRVSRLAGALRRHGLGQGDCISILSLNSDFHLEYYLAVPWMGGVVAPMNFRWSADEIVYALKDSGAKALFIGDGFAGHLDAIRAQCPLVTTLVYCGTETLPEGCLSYEALIADHDPVADVACGGDALYGIFYTGGTTGRSKGVLLTHANILSSAMGILAEGPVGVGAVGLHAAPMFHLADLMMTSCLLLRGGTHIMASAFRPDDICALIEAHKITDLLMVPAMMQVLVEHPAFANVRKDSLRSLMYGASPASEALIDRAMAAMPDVAFCQVYGMTECAATISILRPVDHAAKHLHRARLRSAGRSFCHSEIQIVTPGGAPAGTGEIGEIRVRGPMVMQGYLGKPEATAEALEGGWMHTGDLGYLDPDGYLFIVDRSKDMIISGGENVYSAEVENAVASHPSVAACAVIGIPSEEWGEGVHAVVVLRAGAKLTIEELGAHCRALIAGYKCPRSFTAVDALPISSAGKLLKTELRKPYWEGRTRSVN